jgi:chromosome segregation ATPase
MKRSIIISAILFSLTFGVSGCATNPDPAKGGFIDGIAGLSSGTYQQRLDQRQQNLDQMHQASVQLELQNRDLQQNLATSKATEQSYQAQLAQLQGDIAGLESQVKKAKTKSQTQAAEKKELEQKLADLKAKAKSVKSKSSGANEAALQEELNKLKAEKEALKQQIVKLGAQ